MKWHLALYKDIRGGKASFVLERTDFKSKKEFRENLRGNGCAVVAIYNQKDVDTLKAKPSHLYTKADDQLTEALQCI